MGGAHGFKLRRVRSAYSERPPAESAARPEGAAFPLGAGARRLLADRLQPVVGTDARPAGQQARGIGMARGGEYRVHVRGLDQIARIHHADPVGDLPRRRPDRG